ncbi:MAG: hypothetical protein K8F91_15695, partial [Candidatus Obscuribacterales bacterium]|nr:hypothetical protein [Candidatus Obscuribacterales bacterium]
MLSTVGIDVGSSAIKLALMEHPLVAEKLKSGQSPAPQDGQKSRILSTHQERIRKRDPQTVAEH